MIRVNSLLIFFLSVSLFACSQSGKKVQIPEVGIYSSVTTSVENHYEWEFNPFTKQMEMRLKPHVQIMPSAFGRLEIKANGTYEFIDQKKGGAYKYDEKTKKINFTGYMEAGEATFSYSKSTCILLINVKGKTFSLQYEKASTRPLSETQPDLKTPNADFSGTIVAALGYQSVDYIDLSSAKTTTTFSYTGYTKASGAGQTIHLEEPDRIVNFSLEEPLLEIRDKAGNKLFSYKAKSASGKEWKIARYTGAMLSPDETKFVLTGQQWDAVESYGINIRKYIKAVAGVFNI